MKVLVLTISPLIQAGLNALLATQELCFISDPSQVPAATDFHPDVIMVDAEWSVVAGVVPSFAAIAPLVFFNELRQASAMRRCLANRARGMLLKNAAAEDYAACLQAVAGLDGWWAPPDPRLQPNPHRRFNLTEREQQVADALAGGLKNREIADRLGIATGTVKIHVMHVFDKAGVGDRYSLVRMLRANRPAVVPQGDIVGDAEETDGRIKHPLPAWLSSREYEVFASLGQGKTVKGIAGALDLSVKTVEAHKFNLMRKLGIHSKAQLVMLYLASIQQEIPAALTAAVPSTPPASFVH